MSTTTAARNRDAQLLWDYIEAHFEAGRVPSTDTRIMHDRLDVALATERRLTVEKARDIFAAQMTNPDARWCSADEIAAVLDLVLDELGEQRP